MNPKISGQSVDEFSKWIKRLFAVAVWCSVALVSGGGQVRAESGEEVFAKNCALCHGKDGKAQNPAARKLGVKDLSQSKATEEEIAKMIAEGKKDDQGVQKMPPFKDKLTPEEIKSLVAVVKSFRK
jgi:cytochrome c6